MLNDNEMSISPTVGALSQYLSRIKLSRHVARLASAPTTTWSRSCRWSARRRSSGRAGCASRSSTSPSRASCSRTSASPTSGRCPATDLVRSTRPSAARSARHGRPGHRPRPDPEGPRLPAGRGRPDRLPRRRAAADDASSRSTPSDAPSLTGRGRATATRHPPTPRPPRPARSRPTTPRSWPRS